MRALTSINAEIHRRERLFAANGVNHINQYQKKYKLGEVAEPLPHLFLISDEFAELKQEQPDFMSALVSTARTGRSLGIHLILATQKPAGVVNDQIWSNSRFKIALKVADRQDSNEMLHTPDAAEIIQTGRAYLQVGNNEVYELFQSAWSGADYQPDKDDQGIEDQTIYAINALGQYDILNDDLSGLEDVEDIRQVPSELDAIVHHLHDLTQTLKPLARPWLPPLAERLYLSDFHEVEFREEWKKNTADLVFTVGLADIPQEQKQEVATINLSKDGNVLLYGSPASGKSTFLQTSILDLARTYSPAKLNFYLLDFGSNSLSSFKELPHLADLMRIEETEKVGKFIRILNKEHARRKQLLSDAGVASLSMYSQLTGELIPSILIVLDSYESMKDEPFEDEMFKLLTRLSREGLGVGIHVIVTASRQANLRTTFYSNFKTQMTLYQNDRSEVKSIMKTAGKLETEDIKGRAFMKQGDVYSVQFLLPYEVERDVELMDRLREETSLMADSWQGKRPRTIPMVPDELTAENFYSRETVQKAIKSGYIPLGLDLETVEAVSWDVSVGNFLYIYEQDRNRDIFIINLFNTLQQTSYTVQVLSAEALQNVGGVEIASNASMRSLLIDEIYDTVKDNLEFEESGEDTIVIWNEMDALVQEDAQQLEKMLYILENGPRSGVYNLVITTPNLSIKSDIVSKKIKLMKNALIETRLNDQKILSLNNVKYSEPNLQESLAYFVRNKNYQLMKIVRREK